jgi:hypothetical protein
VSRARAFLAGTVAGAWLLLAYRTDRRVESLLLEADAAVHGG